MMLKYDEKTLQKIKKTLLDKIDNQTEIRQDVKNKYIKLITASFVDKIKYKRYRVLKISTAGNPPTPYLGVTLEIPRKKNILCVIGKNETGKTTTYDQIHHFLCRYDKDSSKKKQLRTDITLTLQDTETNEKYIINYHSRRKHRKGRYFKVTHIKEDGLPVEVSNPEQYLRERLIIDYNLHKVLFIDEYIENSYLARICDKKTALRDLFRIPFLDMILKKLEEYENDIKDKIKEHSEHIEKLNDEIARLNRNKQLIQLNQGDSDFLIKHQEDILNAYDILEKQLDIANVKKKQLIKKTRSISRQEKQIQKQLQSLHQLDIPTVKNEYDLLWGMQKRFCWNCHELVSKNDFKRLASKNKCYICGRGEFNYDDHLQLLFEKLALKKSKKDLSQIKQAEKRLNNQLKALKNNKETLNDKIDLKKPESITDRIWNYVKYIPRVKFQEELLRAEENIVTWEERLATINDELDSHSTKLENLNNSNTIPQTELKVIQTIKAEISSYERKKVQKVSNQILHEANNILILLCQDEKIGELFYNKKNELCIRNVIQKEDTSDDDSPEHTTQEMKVRERPVKLGKDVSHGLYINICIALFLAIIKLATEENLVPIRMTFIDGLVHVARNNKKEILEVLNQIDDFKIILFRNEVPEFLNAELYDIKELLRNPNIQPTRIDGKEPKQVPLPVFFEKRA